MKIVAELRAVCLPALLLALVGASLAACGDDGESPAEQRDRILDSVERNLFITNDVVERYCRCGHVALGYASENECNRALTYNTDDRTAILGCVRQALNDVADVQPDLSDYLRCDRAADDRAYTCLGETPEACSQANIDRTGRCYDNWDEEAEACVTSAGARSYVRLLDEAIEDRCSGIF